MGRKSRKRGGTVTPFPALKSPSLFLKKEEEFSRESSAKRQRYIVIGRGREGAFLFFYSFVLSKRDKKRNKNELTHRPPIRCAPSWWTAVTREGRQRSLRRRPIFVFWFLF